MPLNADGSMIEQIAVDQLLGVMAEQSVVLIDVREPWEFDSGHVPAAQLLPMSLVPGNVDRFRSEQPVFVICRSGNRSGQVVQWLAHQGIHAINVAGGTADWQAHGYPLETPATAATAAVPAERTLS